MIMTPPPQAGEPVRLQSKLRDFARSRTFHWVRDGILLVALIGAVSAWQTRKLLPSAEPMPELPAAFLPGHARSAAGGSGKPMLVTFWAPWCGVCKLESGAISRAKRYAPGVEVVSVALAYQSLGEVSRYVQDQQVDYPVLLGTEKTARDWRVEHFPTTYFISPDGKIRRAAVGYTTDFGLWWRLFF